METETIPKPIREDAPDPDDFETGETVRTMGKALWDIVAVDYDGDRYCLQCANPDYVELCKEDPWSIPAGGAVDRGNLADFPDGYPCGHCHRRIVG